MPLILNVCVSLLAAALEMAINRILDIIIVVNGNWIVHSTVIIVSLRAELRVRDCRHSVCSL